MPNIGLVPEAVKVPCLVKIVNALGDPVLIVPSGISKYHAVGANDITLLAVINCGCVGAEVL